MTTWRNPPRSKITRNSIFQRTTPILPRARPTPARRKTTTSMLNEASDKLDDEDLRICLPLSLFSLCFKLGHCNEMGGHMGASKTYKNAKRLYYWRGMFDCICSLSAGCLTCQNNQPKPKHRNEVPLKNCKTRPFCSEQSILITKDLFTHQLTGTFIAS